MAKLLKDLYTKEYIDSLAFLLKKNYKNFDILNFTLDVFNSSWKDKQLKQRMRHITICIHKYLNTSYIKSIDILKLTYTQIKHKKNKSEALQNMIFCDFVEIYGLDDFKTSFKALEHFTINSTAEFAIRSFILKDENKTMNQMILWAKSPNEQIRRLSSEGCRPKLPWSYFLQNFINNPSKILQILDILQNDESMYVKKSVANNLNDICKNHPNIVINIAKKWYGQNEHKNWIIKHACRTLLKSGNQEVLEIFGYKKRDDIKIKKFVLNDNIKIGEDLNFSFDLYSKSILNNLRIEYSIDFVRLNNKSNNKVFFITQKHFVNSSSTINKKHSFKKINTRKYYKGLHTINIIINGIIVHKKQFNLIG